jgi:hypothetical protein
MQGHVANAADIVGPVPEVWFPVELGDVLGKLIANSPGAGGFQVVDQYIDVERRMDIY